LSAEQPGETEHLGTAVSELARNVCKYSLGSGGDIVVDWKQIDGHSCFEVQVRDNGPGISDLDKALTDHYSTSGTLGMGLPGVRRIVDSFSIVSEIGQGTVVTIGMACP
jgi:serine/threonine-protein kinase RsbT